MIEVSITAIVRALSDVKRETNTKIKMRIAIEYAIIGNFDLA